MSIESESIGKQTKVDGSYIDLSKMLQDKENCEKFVTFDGIKKDSFLRSFEKESHVRLQQQLQNKDKLYAPEVHLLNVTVQNTSYVFDLDE